MAVALNIPKSAGFKDMTGLRYGRLVVISYAGRVKNKSKWNCICDCGSEYLGSGPDLRSGNTSSCGCLHREQLIDRNTRHGLSGTPEYVAWCGMIDRCYRERNKSFGDYGGRGITVCSEWRESFDRFFADMGPRPSRKHSIDRIDNSLGYEPSNCRWATQETQVNNSRKARPLTYRGKTQSIKQWADEFGLSYQTIVTRLHKGFSIEKALTTPLGRWPQKAAEAAPANL